MEDDLSSMRVGTDAILLGAWADLTGTKKILEIGTGCGVIALMLAQRSDAEITAIDIHKDSASQAEINFRSSQWNDRLKSIHISCQEFVDTSAEHFDFVISNPPFFSNSLKSPVSRKNLARHSDTLTLDDLFISGKVLFTLNNEQISEDSIQNSGTICLILPHQERSFAIKTAASHGFNVKRELSVKPKPSLSANRVLLEFTPGTFMVQDLQTLTIRNEDSTFTEEYRELTRDFYLNF